MKYPLIIYLDVPVYVPDVLQLDRFAGKGRQDGELELDRDDIPAGKTLSSLSDSH